MQLVAKTVSIVLGFPWLPIIIFMVILSENISFQHQLILFIMISVFVLIIPLLYLLQQMKSGKITDFDITHREQRYGVLGLILVTSTLAAGGAYVMGAMIVYKYLIVLFVILAINTIITHFWKISLHMGLNIAGSIMINTILDWQAMWLFLTIPVIYWSRLYLRRHTHAQLIGGFVVTGGVTLVGLRLLGLFSGAAF